MEAVESRAITTFLAALETSDSYDAIARAARDAVEAVLGYRSVWLYVSRGSHQRLIAISGDIERIARERFADLPTHQDPYLQHLSTLSGPDIVPDARLDPRTDKAIVAVMQNRTLVHLPVQLLGALVGAIGTGTFGDEGVRPPRPEHIPFLQLVARHMAVALDRVRIWEERQHTAALLDTLLEHLGTGVAVTDAQGVITRENAAFRAIFGSERGASQKLSAVPHSGTPLHRIDGLHREELHLPRHRVVEREVVALPEGKLALYREVTTHRQMLEQTYESRRLESLGRLARSIGHDFNNILATLAVNVALLRERATGGDADVFDDIDATLHHASSLVAHLLTYSGRGLADREPVPVRPLIDQVLRMVHPCVCTSILLSTEGPVDATAIADPTRLRQIIHNLVVNAIDALGKGPGQVNVRVRRQFVTSDRLKRFVLGEALRSADYISIEVSDTGHGMTEAVRSRIFEPRFTTRPGGHGIGLATVLGNLRELGGAIDVRTRQGEGTSFTVYLAEAPHKALRPCGPDLPEAPTPSPSGAR